MIQRYRSHWQYRSIHESMLGSLVWSHLSKLGFWCYMYCSPKMASCYCMINTHLHLNFCLGTQRRSSYCCLKPLLWTSSSLLGSTKHSFQYLGRFLYASNLEDTRSSAPCTAFAGGLCSPFEFLYTGPLYRMQSHSFEVPGELWWLAAIPDFEYEFT